MKESTPFSYKQFFDFEKKYSLFESKDHDLYYWDIIRFEVYVELLWNYTSRPTYKLRPNAGAVVNAIKELGYFIYYVLFTRPSNVFFACSRNKVDEHFLDQNLEDIYRNIEGSKLIVESFQKRKADRTHKKSVYSPIAIVRRLCRPFVKRRDFSDLVEKLKKAFPGFSLSGQDLNHIFASYLIDRAFYRCLFRLWKPKQIFLTQNGIQKGMFWAARKQGIPLLEVQHGIIDGGHIAYNYSEEINYSKDQLHTPGHFLTFSEFWGRGLNFPYVNLEALGNNSFYSAGNLSIEKVRQTRGEGLLVASSDLFGEPLSELVIKLAAHYPSLPIYFKLHPNQFAELAIYETRFKPFSHIHVITNEANIYELIARCDAVLAIQSTALYEALHLGRKAIIYKRSTYTRHAHIFHVNHVFLVDNEGELIEAINNNDAFKQSEIPLFFEPFDADKLKRIIA